MNTNSNLSEVQIACKKIAEELVAVCEENDIQYFVLGGTLLGCVRHKGFIPWDDDIDIGFPRQDYERLLEILKQNHFKLTTYESDPDHISYFAKLTADDVKVIKHRGEHDVVLPVWVDLFPLDGTPDGKTMRWLYTKRLLFWKLMYKFSLIDTVMYDKHRGKMHNFLIWIGKTLHLHKVLNYKKILKRIDTILKHYPYETAEYVGNIMGAWSEKEIFRKSIYDQSFLYDFEDLKLNGPKDYDLILTQMYGDYMTPPAADNRDHHHTEIKK